MEDALDTLIKLHRPEKYTEQDGCIFEVQFEKTMNFFGDDSMNFTAKLDNERNTFEEISVIQNIELTEREKGGNITV